MPYIQRNEQHRIVALTAAAEPGAEFLPVDDPEVIDFLVALPENAADNGKNTDLLLSDLKLIRVIEDVINLLVSKNLIMFSELPSAVQEKILKQRGYRDRFFGSGADIIGTEEGIL
jgi:hypothetical protein